MKNQKILFLEASGGGGHISITTAIIQALKKHPHITTERIDVMPPIAHKFYQLASRQFVNTFLVLYKATNNQKGEIFASKINSIISKKKLARVILDSNADLIFSNYSLAINDVPQILKEANKSVPFIVFVPDPFTAHNIYFSPEATSTLVSTLTSYQAALNKGIPASKLKITGHPIREEFTSKPANIKAHRKKIGLDPDKFTILFGGSGHGAEKTLEILIHLGASPNKDLTRHLIRKANLSYKTYYNIFLKIFKNQYKTMPEFQAICVCGDNTELKKALEMLEFPDYIKPYIHLNSKNIASLIHASDMVVGKAGPNIIFETILAGKPFLATYHIKGQEDGNIDFIKSTQTGFVEENPHNMAKLIETILTNKELLDYTKPGINHIAKDHTHAPSEIANYMLKFLERPEQTII
jgi:UDP-N-acetylglucosamine:LPS N-acetylglucosamine transferase